MKIGYNLLILVPKAMKVYGARLKALVCVPGLRSIPNTHIHVHHSHAEKLA